MYGVDVVRENRKERGTMTGAWELLVAIAMIVVFTTGIFVKMTTEDLRKERDGRGTDGDNGRNQNIP